MSGEKTKTGHVTAGLLMGLILSSLDQTIVSTAMPAIVKGLGGMSLYSWVFAIYMLTSTTCMPIYGKLADLYGRRKVYLTGMLLFLAGSFLCGIAGSMSELIFFRGVQGLGAGALMPLTFIIVADLFPPERRGSFMGLFGGIFAVSSVLGPTLGGVLTDYGSWSWIFWINLPIGILASLLIGLGMTKSQRAGVRPSIDWLGALTMTGAVVSILLALVLGGSSYAWNSPAVVGLFAAGGGLLVLLVGIEKKAAEPIIPLQLFRLRVIAFGSIAGFFMSAAMFGAIAYLPLFVQSVIGVSPSVAGYILTPLMLATAVTSTASGRLFSRFSYRTILVMSLTLMLVGFILLAQMSAETTRFQLILYMIITGLGMGAVYPTLGTAAAGAVEWKLRGAATSSSQFFRSIGGTMGVSMLGTVLTQRMAAGWSRLGTEQAVLPAEGVQQYADPQLLLNVEARASMSPEVLSGLLDVFSGALNDVFIVGAVFLVIGLLASVMLGDARLVQPGKG